MKSIVSVATAMVVAINGRNLEGTEGGITGGLAAEGTGAIGSLGTQRPPIVGQCKMACPSGSYMDAVKCECIRDPEKPLPVPPVFCQEKACGPNQFHDLQTCECKPIAGTTCNVDPTTVQCGPGSIFDKEQCDCIGFLESCKKEAHGLWQENNYLKERLRRQEHCVSIGLHDGPFTKNSCQRRCNPRRVNKNNFDECQKCCGYQLPAHLLGTEHNFFNRNEICSFPRKALYGLMDKTTDPETKQDIDEFIALVETKQAKKIARTYHRFELRTLIPEFREVAREYMQTQGSVIVEREKFEQAAYAFTLIKGASLMCNSYFNQGQCANVRGEMHEKVKSQSYYEPHKLANFEQAFASGDLNKTVKAFMDGYGFAKLLDIAQPTGTGEIKNIRGAVKAFQEDIQQLVMKYHFCALNGVTGYPFTSLDTSFVPQADL